MTAVVLGAGTLVTTAAAVPHVINEPARAAEPLLAASPAAPFEILAAENFGRDRLAALPPERVTAPKVVRPTAPVAPRRASRASVRAPLSPRAIAKAQLASRGWSSQFGCLDSLWTKESNWRVDADNPSSSAYGIPQALPGKKMASAGADWRTNPATQIRWGIGYIAARYGGPCSAWAHSRAYNYY